MSSSSKPVNGSHHSGHPAEAELLAHRRWLRTVLLARSGDEAAVDDLMQEVLLAAEATRNNGTTITDVRPWLYRVAVRQALLHRRSLGRRKRLHNRAAAAKSRDGAEMSPSPLTLALSKERVALVRIALERLPGKDAEILMLKYSENWSYRQIAEHLGMTESAVDGRLHRARGRLRERLKALDVIEEHQ